MPSVSAHVAHTLSAHVDHVFGVMGNGNAAFLDALDATPAHYTAMRHEAGAVAAADAFHRASGRLAAATATYGAGFTNTLTPLAEAVRARVPLVLVVGDAPTGGPRPWDVDQVAMAAAAGATTFAVDRADAAATTSHAIEHALAHRTAVVLAIPYDLAAADAGALTPPVAITVPAPLPPDPAELDAVARLLAGAARPLLLAGRGAWLSGAGEALGRLAAATGAVTATTALARGIFPDAAFDLGVAGGFGQESAMRLVHHADVAVVFGASLNQFTMRFGELFAPGTQVVQVDVGAGPTHAAVTRFVAGDARLAASGIADRLAASDTSPGGWRESIDVAPLRVREAGDGIAADGRLDPRSVAARLAELLPHDRVVVSDGGHFIGWANTHWPVAAPDRMVMVGTAFQSIGLGLPSVPGAAAAKPDATIVLTTGDGGGLMALADLESAVRVAGGRGVAVVWNDAAYGAEVHLYGLQGYADAPMRIPEADFAGLAAAVGAEGVVVRELADLDRLAEWAAEPVASRRFLVLDCRISATVIAEYQHEIIAVNTR